MDKYVFIKTVLQQGEYTFQVKADEDGLILDIFEHFEELGVEHIESKSIFYDEIGLEPICESDQKVKDAQIGKRVMTLQEKAVEMSNRRTEIAGEVNTEWTPIIKSKSKYVRTNSKGEKIFRKDTNETFEYVEKYLKDKDIYFESRRGGSMMWIFIDDEKLETHRQYAYYPTTGRWNSWKSNGIPKKHYKSNGIEDFLTRFALKST